MKARRGRRRCGAGLIVALALGLLASFQAAADPLMAGRTYLVSERPGGGHGYGESPSVSADGRYVAFWTDERLSTQDTDSLNDIYRKDMQTGDAVFVSPTVVGAGPENFRPSISGDGTRVAYISGVCRSLGACFSGAVILRDLTTGTSTLVVRPSMDERYGEYARISRDGRYVAVVYEFSESSGYGMGIWEVATETWPLRRFLCPDACGGPHYVALSANGRIVAYESLNRHVPTDTDEEFDVYRIDRDADADGVFDEPGAMSESLVGILPSGESCWARLPALSDDGAHVAFIGALTVGNCTTGQGTRGQPIQAHIYVRNVAAGTTELISRSSVGVSGSGVVREGHAISADGRYVAFVSPDPHLAPGDANPQFDVFLRDRLLGRTELVSVVPGSIEGTAQAPDRDRPWDGRFVGDRIQPSMSADARFIAFTAKPLLDENLPIGVVYLRDRAAPCEIACVV